MELEELEKLMNSMKEYLCTVEACGKEEYYCSPRKHAVGELQGFMNWLLEKNADEDKSFAELKRQRDNIQEKMDCVIQTRDNLFNLSDLIE